VGLNPLASVHSWLRDDDTQAVRSDGGTVTDPSGPAAVPADPSVPDDSTDEAAATDAFAVDEQVLLDGLAQAAFVIDTEGRIQAWNHGMADLTGIDAADVLDRTDVGMLLYETNEETMIEQVLAAPQTADEVHGLTVADPARNLYVKEDRVADHSGNVEHYARVTVMPLYEDGTLQGAVEMVQDLTEERKRQEATEALVDEVSGTLRTLMAGDLDARASFTDDEAVDSQLLGVLDDVNQMAADLQDIVVRVDEQASHLGDSVERAVTAADDIARNSTNRTPCWSRASTRCTRSRRTWRRSPPPPRRSTRPPGRPARPPTRD
jgi:methyl-accepting chemotaxis protein